MNDIKKVVCILYNGQNSKLNFYTEEKVCAAAGKFIAVFQLHKKCLVVTFKLNSKREIESIRLGMFFRRSIAIVILIFCCFMTCFIAYFINVVCCQKTNVKYIFAHLPIFSVWLVQFRIHTFSLLSKYVEYTFSLP